MDSVANDLIIVGESGIPGSQTLAYVFVVVLFLAVITVAIFFPTKDRGTFRVVPVALFSILALVAATITGTSAAIKEIERQTKHVSIVKDFGGTITESYYGPQWMRVEDTDGNVCDILPSVEGDKVLLRTHPGCQLSWSREKTTTISLMRR